MTTERHVSRWAFWLTRFVVFILLGIAEAAVAERVFGLPWDRKCSTVVGGMFVPNLGLAHVLADVLFERLGLFHSGQSIESRRRTPRPPCEDSSSEESLEIRYSRSQCYGGSVVCLALGGAILMLNLLLPEKDQSGTEWVPVLVAWLLASAVFFVWLPSTVILRADARGLSSFRHAFSVFRTFVPWDEIASCDFLTIGDFAGRSMPTYPRLKDAGGRDLFRGLADCWAFLAPPDRDRLLLLLKQRFSKPAEDDWSV